MPYLSKGDTRETTLEQRRERYANSIGKLTLEERRDNAKKAAAKLTPEERRERARKASVARWAKFTTPEARAAQTRAMVEAATAKKLAMSPEERRKLADNFKLNTPEKRHEHAVKAGTASMAKLSPEERRAKAKRANIKANIARWGK